VSVTEIAIVVIAVAVTAQTLMMAVGLVAGIRAWRTVRTEVEQMQATLDQRLEAVSARIDEAVVDARIAARAVENLATRADGLVQDAASAAHTVGTAVTFPKALLLTGAASAAKWVLSKWRPRRPRSVGPVDSLGSAEVF
jgi:hypothetical protein